MYICQVIVLDPAIPLSRVSASARAVGHTAGRRAHVPHITIAKRRGDDNNVVMAKPDEYDDDGNDVDIYVGGVPCNVDVASERNYQLQHGLCAPHARRPQIHKSFLKSKD